MNIYEEEYEASEEEGFNDVESLYEEDNNIVFDIKNKLILEDMDDFYQNV